ncbi:uncharacterized protein EDB91DRAFT_1131136 [Suillus paluster]|uniref:uncharacterized protein n=1 Tax=Suillus paluster TaxID=48578 RepID=UPI001B87DE12|nr:uncharacterized protein EDB91DRAFT_1131136 [Suillus paluster]KAG1741559.1 hypothetical protein EDB91DRAFT_1131136 [Suillus paluster]
MSLTRNMHHQLIFVFIRPCSFSLTNFSFPLFLTGCLKCCCGCDAILVYALSGLVLGSTFCIITSPCSDSLRGRN